MRDFAQGTPELTAPAQPPEPAAPARQAAPQFRVKATAQPVRPRPAAQPAAPKPAAGGRRLRNVRHPVSQMLRDQIEKIDSQTDKR